MLTPQRLYKADINNVARLIRPCGYYNLKAARIRNFLNVLFGEFEGELSLMFSLSCAELRKKLLTIKGIGRETADSIILYAARKPKFVIDTYTRRVLIRHSLIDARAGYDQLQYLFEQHLPRRSKLFNEYHALIVRLAKEFCRKKPLCDLCPLRKLPKRSSAGCN